MASVDRGGRRPRGGGVPTRPPPRPAARGHAREGRAGPPHPPPPARGGGAAATLPEGPARHAPAPAQFAQSPPEGRPRRKNHNSRRREQSHGQEKSKARAGFRTGM